MNLFELWASPAAAYRWIAVILGAGLVHATLPLLANRKLFRRGGLYPTYPNDLYPLRGRRRVIAAVLDDPGMCLLLVIRISGAIWLVASAWRCGSHPLAAGVLFGIGCLLCVRVSLIEDNASSMNHVALAALTFHAIEPGSSLIAEAGLWFIALQLCAAYVPGGVSKIRSANWRNGSHFANIFADSMLRFPALGRWLRAHAGAARAFSWGTILLQLGFPLALFAPAEIAVVLVGGALAFHAGIAVLMGLSNFLWSFAACYPAVFWVNRQVRDWISEGFL